MKDHPDVPLPKVLRGNCNCGDFTTMAGADSRCFYCKAAEEIEELESVISRQYEYSKAKSAEIEQLTKMLKKDTRCPARRAGLYHDLRCVYDNGHTGHHNYAVTDQDIAETMPPEPGH